MMIMCDRVNSNSDDNDDDDNDAYLEYNASFSNQLLAHSYHCDDSVSLYTQPVTNFDILEWHIYMRKLLSMGYTAW